MLNCDWKSEFNSEGIARIPPGIYRLRIESLIFFPFEATVAVDRPSTVYFAGLIFAGINNIPASDKFRGRFAAPPGEGAWCKLSGLFTLSSYFAEVQPNGTFAFLEIPVGSYALVCMRGSTTLDLRIITLRIGGINDVEIKAP